MLRQEMLLVTKAVQALKTYVQRKIDYMESGIEEDDPIEDGAHIKNGLVYKPVEWAKQKGMG